MLWYGINVTTTNMMLARCKSGVRIVEAYVTDMSTSPDHDIIETTSMKKHKSCIQSGID